MEISQKNIVPQTVESTAIEASRVMTNKPCIVYEVRGYNSGAEQFILLFDSKTLPAEGTVANEVVKAGADNNWFITFPKGKLFEHGLTVCNSSTAPTKTIGGEDCFFVGEFVT